MQEIVTLTENLNFLLEKKKMKDNNNEEKLSPFLCK